MRGALPLAVLGCLVLAFTLSRNRDPEVLQRVVTDYLEDGATGRSVAAIETTLLGDDDGVVLRVTASATGPHVDPVYGYEGIRGANRIAARELDRIVRERRARVVSTNGTGRVIEGSYAASRHGRIPMRRVVDGKIRWQGMSEREYVLELSALTGVLPPGTWTTELRVDRKPRLRVRTEIDESGGRILDVFSLDGHSIRGSRQ